MDDRSNCSSFPYPYTRFPTTCRLKILSDCKPVRLQSQQSTTERPPASSPCRDADKLTKTRAWTLSTYSYSLWACYPLGSSGTLAPLESREEVTFRMLSLTGCGERKAQMRQWSQSPCGMGQTQTEAEWVPLKTCGLTLREGYPDHH